MAYFWSRGSNQFLQKNMRGSSTFLKENSNGLVLLYLSTIIFHCHYKWQTGVSTGTFSPFTIWLLHQFIAITFLNANSAKIIYRNKIIFYRVAYYQKTCTLPLPPTTSISCASKNFSEALFLWKNIYIYLAKYCSEIVETTKISRKHNYHSRASKDISLLQMHR